MPPAARTLFEKRVLDSQKLLFKQINHAPGVAGRCETDSKHSPHIDPPRRAPWHGEPITIHPVWQGAVESIPAIVRI